MKDRVIDICSALAGAVGLCLLTACSTALPLRPSSSAFSSPDGAKESVESSSGLSLGNEIAIRAIALVGLPYRYGGADLDGFDCSGLVFFIHEQLGLTVPRTAAEQQLAALAVKRNDLKPGDLLFFRTHGRKVSHVGIYVGENRFVHAPQSGRLIELRSLDDKYYGARWVAAGRLRPNS
jgi:murein DD-endopeptidase